VKSVKLLLDIFVGPIKLRARRSGKMIYPSEIRFKKLNLPYRPYPIKTKPHNELLNRKDSCSGDPVFHGNLLSRLRGLF
jgi:hypothetical protein